MFNIIDIAAPGALPSSFAPPSMSFPRVLQKVTAALDGAGVAYMLTSPFARAYYGSPRSTQAIDLVIAATPAQLRMLVENLPASEPRIRVED